MTDAAESGSEYESDLDVDLTDTDTDDEIDNNMKPARPWMLAHLKIIWQFQAHPVHQKVSRLFGPR